MTALFKYSGSLAWIMLRQKQYSEILSIIIIIQEFKPIMTLSIYTIAQKVYGSDVR